MAERPNAHAWKACGAKVPGGSNPPLSDNDNGDSKRSDRRPGGGRVPQDVGRKRTKGSLRRKIRMILRSRRIPLSPIMIMGIRSEVIADQGEEENQMGASSDKNAIFYSNGQIAFFDNG